LNCIEAQRETSSISLTIDNRAISSSVRPSLK
jgi:hypothetical protein